MRKENYRQGNGNSKSPKIDCLANDANVPKTETCNLLSGLYPVT